MRKIYFLPLLLSLFIHVALAQPRLQGEPERIIALSDMTVLNPMWSPDGEWIAFSADRHDGIWVSRFDGSNIRQITADTGSGFGFSWSEDATKILSRSAVMTNFRKFHNVKVYDVKTGDARTILEQSRQLKGLPVWSNGDEQVVMILGKDVKKVDSGIQSLKKSGGTEKTAVPFSGTLVQTTLGEPTTPMVDFPEFQGRFVFNSIASPQGDKVVFQVSGLGLFVAGIDGQGLKQIGHGEQASWMPDGRFVVVSLVKDDGKVVRSGELFAVDVVTGSYYPLLSRADIVALNPDISRDGKKMLFENSLDGSIQIVHFQQ